MHRFFVDDAGFQGEVVCLEETDARHARRVLRLRPGEEVVLMDGARRFRGEILDGAGEAVACRLLEEGRMPVTEIGQLCGLGSGSYLGKVFREAFRCTPQS